MGARYSDRFFGPEGVGGHPAPDAPSAETIELVERVDTAQPQPPLPEHGEAPLEARPWYAQLAARAALVGAILIGAGGGAYAWDWWRDHQTDVVARSAIDLSATARLESLSPDQRELAMSVQLRNDGPYAVTVTDVSAIDVRLTLADDTWRLLNLDRGEEVSRVIRFTIDCGREVDPDLDTPRAPWLVANLTTIDGQEHQERLGVLDVGYYYGGTLGQMLSDQCAFESQRASFSSLYAEIGLVQALGDDAVTSTVLLNDHYSGSPAVSPITVTAAPAGSAFSVALRAREPTDAGLVGSLFVTWKVNDCAAALLADDSDMTLDLTGSTPSDASTSTVTVYPSAALAVALGRLSERVCS